jgi:hypothetical protein
VELGEDVVLIVVFVSVLFVVAGEGFTIVVLDSFFSPAGGFTVSVFCSQAASNDAAPARMHMYFFIRLLMEDPMWITPYSAQQGLSALPWANVHPPSEPSASLEKVWV